VFDNPEFGTGSTDEPKKRFGLPRAREGLEFDRHDAIYITPVHGPDHHVNSNIRVVHG
jgi:hypothetical protein